MALMTDPAPATGGLDEIAPERMHLRGSWRERPMSTELYIDDRAGDGHLVGADAAGQHLCAVISHSGGVLGPLIWRGPAALWNHSRKELVKSRIQQTLAGRRRGQPS